MWFVFSRGRHIHICCGRADEGKYKLVGACYVHGIMNGEAMAKGDLTEQSFTII